MEKEQIKERLQKVFDEFTTDTLLTSIIDFQRLFNEKYLKTEEVIDLVINNTPKGIVIYDDVGNRFDASCSLTDKQFKVNKDIIEDTDYFNYVFFHEFIHAISSKKYKDAQYMGFYTKEKGDDYEFKSKPFNEVVTEYIALKRNELYNYTREDGTLSGYELGATQLQLITKLIPEEEFVDAFFNRPYELENIFKKYNMNMDELLYSFYSFEEMASDVYYIENKRGIEHIDRLFKLIDGERYLYYNLFDSIGNISNEEEFNNKWNILLSEYNFKYNFYNVDGIFRYGCLIEDIKRLKIDVNNEIYINNKEKIDKYKVLSSWFFTKDYDLILKNLNAIYKEDYKKYFNLVKDDFAILPYTFLKELKNNAQLLDLEIYPRVYPYLEKENATIENVEFKKVKCNEMNVKIYIFNINGNNYIETNYDDVTITKKTNTLFEIKFEDQIDIFDIEKNTYKYNDKEYKCEILY